MPIPKIPGNKTKALIAVAFMGWMTVLACTVDVKDRDGDKSKVDIQTPVGGIHVDEQANVRDTGLTLYPGARQKEKKDNDSKNANVNISSSFFGVKVVAVEYESDDPPSKVQAFYQEQLKKFGQIVVCRTNSHGGDLTVKAGHESSKREVRCDGDNTGKVTELKVGTEDNQHMVSVEAQGSGTDFALVFIQTRGKEGTI
jgi:hypothetical protein